jgi:rhodanese-related sulfurtransferase
LLPAQQEAIKTMDAAVTPIELTQRLAAFPPPTLVDVRRQAAFDEDPTIIPGAIRRLPEAVETWGADLEPWRPVVVYCVRGHEVSQGACTALRARGLDARYVAGGVERWRAEGNVTKPFAAPTRWVTRARPKIDRVACPWLIRRFIDTAAEFFYVPDTEVRAFAAADGATAYDIPDVPHSHVGEECSFDAFIRLHGLGHPALAKLALIVRAADTSTPHLAAQVPGLLAASLGLSAMFADDHAMLRWGMLVYDSLYAWCRAAQTETHGWYPEKLPAGPR